MDVRSKPGRPRVDLIVPNVVTRAMISDCLQQAGLRVIEHLPGIEVDFAGPRDAEPDCIVIVHEPTRLDALVLTLRLRSIGIRSPILVLAAAANDTFRDLAAQTGVNLLTGPADPRAVLSRTLDLLDEDKTGFRRALI